MGNEELNATALETPTQEQSRNIGEFIETLDQQISGSSKDESESIISPELQKEEPVQPEVVDQPGIKKFDGGEDGKTFDALDISQEEAINLLESQRPDLFLEQPLDKRPWWHANWNPADPKSILAQASAAQFRDYATVPQEINASIKGEEYTPKTLGELGFTDYSYQNTLVESIAIDGLDFLYDLIPALYIPGGWKLLMGGGWKAAALKTGVYEGIASTDIRTGGIFGTSKKLPAIKNQIIEWNAILKEGGLTPFTNLPGLSELQEPVEGDKTSWDSNFYLNRIINISEMVAVEMTGEKILGGILSAGWKQLRKIPLSQLDKITGPAGVYIRNLRRNMDSFVSQKRAVAKDQLSEQGFGAYKNADIKDTNQGMVFSSKKSFDVKKDLDLIDGDIGGSTKVPSNFTEQVIRNTAKRGNSAALKTNLNKAAKELLGDTRYQELISAAKSSNKTFTEFFEPSFNRYQEMMGRNKTNVSARTFWKALTDNKTNAFGGLTQEDIVTAELVNNALALQLRDISQATKMVMKDSDIFVPDGPMRSIADRLVNGISMVKRSRFLQQAAESGLSESAITERITGMHDETVDGVRLMMQLLKNSDSDTLTQGVLEVFSKADKIQNWMDFDRWVRQKISGGEFNGRVATGAVVKELQTMMNFSMLLGTKTPQRAILGTGFNMYLNQFNTVLGSAIRFAIGRTDNTGLHANTAALHGMIEFIPDALKLFRKNLNANFDKDLNTIKSRFNHYSVKEHNWEMYRKWTEERGTLGDKASFYIADVVHKLNSNRFLSGVPRILRANDDTAGVIAAKGRAKELAMREILAEQSSVFPVIDETILSKTQDKFFNQLIDADGNLDTTKDLFVKHLHEEATLTGDIGRYGEALNKVFNALPGLKPFYFFMRTGINSLKVNTKNMPLLSGMLKESREIAFGTPSDVKSGALQKWGITTVEELENAKSLLWGRQALGLGLTWLGVQKYLHNGLTGNGPANRSQKGLWQDTGWKGGKIEIGGALVDVDLFEPWGIMFKAIADVGDNLDLMGPEWAEDRLSAIAWTIAGSATNNTFLQGASQMIDILTAQPGTRTRTISNILNNQVPGANLRNQIGKTLNPGLLEVNNSIQEQIRKRNATSEYLSLKPLKHKYSLLDGKKIMQQNFLTREMCNWTIFCFEPKGDAGEQLIKESNYDMRPSTNTTPKIGPYPSISLEDNSQLRSTFQRFIGETRINGQSLRARLNVLAQSSKIQASIKEMNNDRKSGRFDLNPMKAYYHTSVIGKEIDKFRTKGMARLIARMKAGEFPELQVIFDESKQTLKDTRSRRYKTSKTPVLPLHPGR